MPPASRYRSGGKSLMGLGKLPHFSTRELSIRARAKSEQGECLALLSTDCHDPTYWFFLFTTMVTVAGAESAPLMLIVESRLHLPPFTLYVKVSVPKKFLGGL